MTLLEPGDLVIVANPTDPWLLRLLLFWSHVAIYVGESDARAFVDSVNLPIRRAGRARDHGLPWQRVRYSSLRMFRSYIDVLALRPPLPPEARRAAAEFAKDQVGRPFPRNLLVAFFKPRRPGTASEFTCSSLVWEAYKAQGFDLASGPLGRLVLPWPSLLGHDRRLAHTARGTRLRPFRGLRVPWSLFLARVWFRWVLRSDIDWRGPPAPTSSRPIPDTASRPVRRAGR